MGEYIRIPIQVYYCRLCHQIISILPSFCIPYKLHTVLVFEKFFRYLLFTKLSLSQVVEKARKYFGYHQLAQAWIKSFKGNIINLISEIRSLEIEKYHIKIKDKYQISDRYQDILTTWLLLQKLSYYPLFQSLAISLPLENAQYILWQKKRLGLFAFIP